MQKRKWWQSAVFYQIYPRSFADANGDGIGDIPGMISRLDYLQDLGVNAIWLSPHYPSPLVDVGYDVADYTGVAPEYGTLDDFRRFLEGLHQRGMHLILDLVLNHTSDQHPWFRDSASSRDNPRRDWYVWHPGRNGGPPNNWLSAFGGSAWELDPRTGDCYYHYFFKEQPDLNWRNPAVKQAIFDGVRFWLDLGVDGFRLDAIGTLFEDPDLPDHSAAHTPLDLLAMRQAAQTPAEKAAIEQQWRAIFQHQVDQPGVHEVFRELRALVDEYEDRVLVGETDNLAYHGSGEDELHLVFNFPLMRTERLTPAWVRANQQLRLSELPPGAWPCNTLGNHDSPRVYSRYGDGQHDAALARYALALVLTLQGTPFLYNGEEIGMTDFHLADIRQFRDMIGVWLYHAAQPGLGLGPEAALVHANEFGRDKCRTPMQWANAPHGGFCPAEVEPWLPVNPNYAAGVNVAEQAEHPASLLNFYRRLLRFRRGTPALVLGDYQPLHEAAPDYLAFLRRLPEQTCLVVLSGSPEPLTVDFSAVAPRARRLFSSEGPSGDTDDLGALNLAPFEIYVAEIA